MMPSKLYLLALLGGFVGVNGKTITQDTVDKGTINVSGEPYTISQGILWSIVDNAYTAFTNQFFNLGYFYVSTDHSNLGLSATINNGAQLTENTGYWTFNSQTL